MRQGSLAKHPCGPRIGPNPRQRSAGNDVPLACWRAHCSRRLVPSSVAVVALAAPSLTSCQPHALLPGPDCPCRPRSGGAFGIHRHHLPFPTAAALHLKPVLNLSWEAPKTCTVPDRFSVLNLSAMGLLQRQPSSGCQATRCTMSSAWRSRQFTDRRAGSAAGQKGADQRCDRPLGQVRRAGDAGATERRATRLFDPVGRLVASAQAGQAARDEGAHASCAWRRWPAGGRREQPFASFDRSAELGSERGHLGAPLRSFGRLSSSPTLLVIQLRLQLDNPAPKALDLEVDACEARSGSPHMRCSRSFLASAISDLHRSEQCLVPTTNRFRVPHRRPEGSEAQELVLEPRA